MKKLATPYNFSARKQTIARHFANASAYNQHAHIQQQVCQNLLANIARTEQDSVLEIGAGTGQMTRLLAEHIQSRHWLINELCAEQAPTLQAILATAKIAIGDAETMDLQSKHSLIISANTVQWFDDPLSFVAQSAPRLQAKGQLIFNTFTANNFSQIKTLTGQGLYYPAVEQWELALTDAGLVNIEVSIQRFDSSFANPYAVLKHMQLTGVSTNRTQAKTSDTQLFTWTKARLQQFELDYWQHFSGKDPQGDPCVNLTYEVLTVSAFKP